MPKKKYIERIILELRLIIENIDILQRIFSYAICLIKRVKIQKLLFEIEICVYRDPQGLGLDMVHRQY